MSVDRILTLRFAPVLDGAKVTVKLGDLLPLITRLYTTASTLGFTVRSFQYVRDCTTIIAHIRAAEDEDEVIQNAASDMCVSATLSGPGVRLISALDMPWTYLTDVVGSISGAYEVDLRDAAAMLLLLKRIGSAVVRASQECNGTHMRPVWLVCSSQTLDDVPDVSTFAAAIGARLLTDNTAQRGRAAVVIGASDVQTDVYTSLWLYFPRKNAHFDDEADAHAPLSAIEQEALRQHNDADTREDFIPLHEQDGEDGMPSPFRGDSDES